jgi:hypothetical protein
MQIFYEPTTNKRKEMLVVEVEEGIRLNFGSKTFTTFKLQTKRTNEGRPPTLPHRRLH